MLIKRGVLKRYERRRKEKMREETATRSKRLVKERNNLTCMNKEKKVNLNSKNFSGSFRYMLT